MEKAYYYKDFEELSYEEDLELHKVVDCELDIQKRLETVFSFVGFDEEGYLNKNFGTEEGGQYFIEYGQELILFKFIEKKSYESLSYWKNRHLEENLNDIPTSREKLYFLNT